MSKYDIITAGTVIQLDRNIKPKKTADELVNKLQNEKGITFNIIDKNTALIISEISTIIFAPPHIEKIMKNIKAARIKGNI